jgi:hypothetical protein
MYLNLNPRLYGWLFKQLFETFFQQLFASLFGSMFESMLVWSHAPSYLALRRQRLPGRQPVGRGVGGRIVVLRTADTIRCGADIAPRIYARMIRILITRLFSSGRVTSQFSTPYSHLPRSGTLAGGRLWPVPWQVLLQGLCQAPWQILR